jgi:hypothetical protein
MIITEITDGQRHEFKTRRCTMNFFRVQSAVEMLARFSRSSGAVQGFFATAMYHQKVIDHFSNPQNVGKLDSKDKDVGTAIVGAPACGDTLQFQIKVDTETRVIKDVKFKAFGCPSAIAS